MAKGSQLTQLKAALSQAGITSQSKKRKRPVPEQDKEKRAVQLDGIQRRLNPFDVKVTKLKHDVGGRKLKGITGKPAKSKQAGVERVCRDYDSRYQVDDSYCLIPAQEDVAERVR
jgi:nucleolar protein 14